MDEKLSGGMGKHENAFAMGGFSATFILDTVVCDLCYGQLV
jgi:hypothetical protein